MGGGGCFDVVLCQLVLSVVGDRAHRLGVLRSAAGQVRGGGGGRVLVSASGDSAALNPSYEALYAQDFPVTHEHRTYVSRGARGEVLYVTHHFTAQELRTLLQQAGLRVERVVEEEEASSRRPDEKALFLYATASKP